MSKRPRSKTSTPASGGQRIGKVTGQAVLRQTIRGNQINNYPAPPRPAFDAGALEGYHRHVAQSFCDLTDASLRFLQGRDGGSREVAPPRLAEVYIALDTSPDRPAVSDREAKSEEGRLREGRPDTVSLPALKRVADHDRLVLLGAPGSGKSTFLRHLSLCLARHALEPGKGWLKRLACGPEGGPKSPSGFAWPGKLATHVPVFVELRKFADELAQSPPADLDRPDCERLWKFVIEQLKPGNLGDVAPGLAAAIESGNAIVFLDGFDEVPSDALKRFVAATVAEFARGRFAPSRFVVTCRTVSYRDEAWQLPGFTVAELVALDAPKIERFVERFYTELAECGRIGADVAAGRVVSLAQAIGQREELREMAGNPYLLSLMAQLHVRMELPAQRAALFEKFVEELLFSYEADKRRDAKGPPPAGLSELLGQAGTKPLPFRNVLSRLAYDAHRGGVGGLAKRGDRTSIYIPEQALSDALAELPPRAKWPAKAREDWAKQVIHLIEHRTGLLMAQGRHLFGMAFKLQEFMAAGHLCNPDEFEFEKAAELIADDSGYWDEVVRLAAGYQAHVKQTPSAARSLALTLCRSKAPSDAAGVRRAALAGEILREIGVNDVERTAQGADCLRDVRATLNAFAERIALPIRLRAEAASARGWLEALPRGVGLRPDGVPDLDFDIELPMGKFTLAQKPQRVEIGRPFRLSRFPVTVAQYEAFVADGGYGGKDTSSPRPAWWSEEGWRWRNGGSDTRAQPDWVRDQYQKETFPILRPKSYPPAFQTPNHPRVGVSWFEAEAFCGWLTELLRRKGPLTDCDRIELPSEAQWEWAARWNRETGQADDRRYSWGASAEEELAERCNMKGTGLGLTSAVGLFPSGQADCGAMDLSGNVWEWCADWYDKDEDARVVRGGSWSRDFPGSLSCGSRGFGPPELRYAGYGFRCVWVGMSAR